MKKQIISILAILCLMFSLIGCRKLVDTKYENVEVTIVDEYHRGTYIIPFRAGKVTTMVRRPAVYQITVEYNNVEYTINGSDTYNKYKDKVGQTIVGTLETRTYDDTVRYDITKLK